MLGKLKFLRIHPYFNEGKTVFTSCLGSKPKTMDRGPSTGLYTLHIFLFQDLTQTHLNFKKS